MQPNQAPVQPDDQSNPPAQPTQVPSEAPLPQQPVNTFGAEPTVPPKKSRRGLVAIIIAGAVLIIAAILGILAWTTNSQAASAAKDYKEAVVSRVDDILTAETPKLRAELFTSKPELKDVAFGATLNGDYKAAQDLKVRFDSLIDDNRAIVEQRYATLDLSPFLKRVSTELSKETGTKVPRVTDESTKQVATQTLDSLREKGKNYRQLADEFLTYKYDAKYQDAQKKYSEVLKSMGMTWTLMADAQQKVVDKDIEVLNETDEVKKTNLNLEALTESIKAAREVTQFSSAYKGKELTPAMNAFIQPIVADGYIQSIATKIQDVQKKFTDLQTELKN